MKRQDLLKDRSYVTTGIQLKLLNLIEDYMKEHKLTRTDLAKKLHVSKGYITQILNASYDHKISKLVDLAISLDNMPLINFVDLETFIREDEKDKFYALMPMTRSKFVTFEKDVAYNLSEEIELTSYDAPYVTTSIKDTDAVNAGIFTVPSGKF